MNNVTHQMFAELAGDLFEGGDASPPLVLLHGLTFDRSMWTPALSELRRLQPTRTTLALDLPGHGQSAAAFRRLDAVTSQVSDAVAAAGLEQPVYVGHSIGIQFAMQLAGEGGSSGVVNVDAALFVGPLFATLERLAARIHSPEFPEVWAELLAGQHPELLPPDGEALVRATSRPRRQIAIGYWSPIFESGAAEAGEQVLVAIRALRSLRTPYLIVAGNHLDPAYQKFLARNFPEAEVVCLPGSGHFPHLAHPEAFAKLLVNTGSWPDLPDRSGGSSSPDRSSPLGASQA
jgi:pimeloyl-ACP methyl ester carboxylesterase